MRYVPEQFYLRSAEEMKALFAEVPEAIQNTLEVAEKCNVELKFGELHYPVFEPPEHFTREGYLRKLLADGLGRRYGMVATAQGQEFVVESIEDARNTVLITGFQAENTLGRKIVEKQVEVPIFGEPMRLRAEVVRLNELSGHADQHELIEWMKPLMPGLKGVFLVHGEMPQGTALKAAIQAVYPNLRVEQPARGDSFRLE